MAKEILSQPDQKFTVEGLAVFSTEIKPEHTRVNNLDPEKGLITVPAKLKAKASFSPKLGA